MKWLPILFLIAVLISVESIAQDIPDSLNERNGLAHLMRTLNLKPSDLTFREDYSEIDSLRLKTISELTANPYGMIEFTEQLADKCRERNPRSIINAAFTNLSRTIQVDRQYADVSPNEESHDGYSTYYNSMQLNRLLSLVYEYLDNIIPRASDSTFALLDKDQVNFLVNEFKELTLEDTADENRSVEVIDSITKAEERYIETYKDFAYKIRKDFILDAGVKTSVMIYEEIERLLTAIDSGGFDIVKILADTMPRPRSIGQTRYLGINPGWAIGGPGDNVYRGDYQFIIDFGGNDYYQLEYDPEKPHGTIIIDLSGNDTYVSATDFTIGSGCLSVGLLYDMAGDDTYNGSDFSIGSGYFGFGLLYDKSGHDKYYGDTHTEGAATCGIGLLLDDDGSDVYSGAVCAQGYGLIEGFGMIVDRTGNDNYMAGGKYKAIIHYDDHYLSISQGYGGGAMLFLSGGIGGIVDLAGNDNYSADMVGQGCGWWYGLGFIYDYAGNDQYLSYQYSQGTGVHMGLGLLIDEHGKDFYRGKGLMQGVGHDYSCGILLDRNGDDIYQAESLSQGAGSANGFGILIDSRGNDAYYSLIKTNTQGYGNPRRDFGSIGLFMDLSGTDIYDGNGSENSYWKTDSKWGGGFDLEFIKQSDSTKAEGVN